MKKLELITKAQKEVETIAENTQNIQDDCLTGCYISADGSLIITKIHKGLTAGRLALIFCDDSTQKQVITKLNRMREVSEMWDAERN